MNSSIKRKKKNNRIKNKKIIKTNKNKYRKEDHEYTKGPNNADEFSEYSSSR